MDQATHNKIVSFIWGIADDVLRDLFKRGKYPDVILPMCVIRRMDTVLESTKQTVLETKKLLDDARIMEQRAALCDAAGQAFYNTSRFTLRDLKSRGSQQRLLADFEDYLNGFSPNVQDILENFNFRNQLHTLSKADAIGTLINKFLDPDIDLSPNGIDNHSMGTVLEALVRKFNEENNEEAGEHWTPRDAVRLMANLVFLPIEPEIKSGIYLLSDCACGTGGMLTVAEETLATLADKRGQQVKCLLYGQEINPETYAVCKADMLLKGEGESADHIVGGAEWSTLAHEFDARGHLIGLDKIGHFFAEGWIYFEMTRYDNETLENAMDWGSQQEAGKFGNTTTGIYSFADLVANFNGWRFWNEIALTADDPLRSFLGNLFRRPYVRCEIRLLPSIKHGRVVKNWKLVKRFDLADYIDGAWDEGNNCNSHADPIIEDKVERRIQDVAPDFKCPVNPADCVEARQQYGKFAKQLLHLSCLTAGGR